MPNNTENNKKGAFNPAEYTIDAKGRTLGRVASEAASLLMGKNVTAFRRDRVSGSKVIVLNVGKLQITAKKEAQKTYKRYSGYPGGLKKEKFSHLKMRLGIEETLRHAVYGMLPSNKLRNEMMKNLKFQK